MKIRLENSTKIPPFKSPSTRKNDSPKSVFQEILMNFFQTPLHKPLLQVCYNALFDHKFKKM
jgi:hypothetical protein